MSRSLALVLSCEHGGNRVPPRYRSLFVGASRLLASHRGFDRGALRAARRLARLLRAPLIAAATTRLLIDLNRSEKHPRLFSEYARALDEAERRRVLDTLYLPHRARVEDEVRAAAARGQGLHLAVHSFTPVLDGVRRRADVGLLYDPARPSERRFAVELARSLGRLEPGLVVRRNYPYRGTSDGLTTHLRKLLPDARYLGIEVELNQALAAEPRRLDRVTTRLADAVALVASGWRAPRRGRAE